MNSNLILKTKTVIFLVFAACISGLTISASAQNITVNQLQHELKVYKDVETRQLFWPKDLPVYVWLSTSTEQNAAKHQLKESYIKNSDGISNVEKTHINLELSGNQYLRWINFETKDTLMLRFQSDGISPVSSISLGDAPTYTADSVTFYGKGLKAGFSATDEHAGTDHIYVSVNGADFTPYFGTYDFNQEKEYSISFYAVDRVGNVENVKQTAFSVDLTAPRTQHQVTGISQGSILASSAKIKLISTDQLSGVGSVYFYFDDNATNAELYSEPVSVTSLSEGLHTLYYYSVDKVGNEEKPNVFEFYVDKSAPKTQLLVEGDQFSRDILYVSARTDFSIRSEDNRTGVKFIQYKINQESPQKYNSGSFKLPAMAGEYTISYWADDNVSNREEINSQTMMLDTEAPSSSHDFNGPFYTRRDKTWISSQTKLLINAKDKGSGVKKILYSVEGQNTSTSYDEALSFTNEGCLNLLYWATDHVNNAEKENALSLIVDNTAPELLANFSSNKIGSKTADDGSVLDIYPSNTMFYLAATDASSGASDIWITLNDSEEAAFPGSINLEVPGEQIIRARSSDRVGNEVVETYRFIISE